MSEIGLKDYLRLLDKLIQLQDQRGFPTQLETGDTKPVFDISRYIPEFNVRAVPWQMSGIALGGLGEFELPVISTGEDGSYDLRNKNARFFGLGVQIILTVAGAAAFVGNRLSRGWSVIDRSVGSIKIPFNFNQLENGKLVVAGVTNYNFFLGASGNTSVYNALLNTLLIGPTIASPNPSPGFGLACTLTPTTGAGVLTVFPAGTTATVSALFYETDQPLIPPV
jgi:hypothetical protein